MIFSKNHTVDGRHLGFRGLGHLKVKKNNARNGFLMAKLV